TSKAITLWRRWGSRMWGFATRIVTMPGKRMDVVGHFADPPIDQQIFSFRTCASVSIGASCPEPHTPDRGRLDQQK
ncbi:MAG: hypothetical protein Q8S73_36125, partial [Deltaproteobacteria bacterium]|nr:hypothetical protein [Myxococcales bacterium]MDP3219586.1 hypothetical protein [Deltaproteobacteria bacterium]